MIDYLPKAAKPVLGPVWRKGLHISSSYTDPSGDTWLVTSLDECGRAVHWKCGDRVARTEVTPDHPDYPPDLTREQLREKARLAKEAKKAMGWFGYIP